MKKALIAMSGGVDSSTAAYLTKQAGYDCIGCTMKLRDTELSLSEENACCTSDDIEDARKVCETLQMPFSVLNFKEDFRRNVIEPFICSYEHAETPNPCVLCNERMKFGMLYAEAERLGCDKVVTGHYARIAEENGRYYLKKAANPEKDQSYVLYRMTEDRLRHTLFPLGDYRKEDIRALAESLALVNANKPDSQDICFVPDGDYAKVITEYTGKTYAPGDFVLRDGTVVGRHKGLIHYTIGQRKGLGISWSSPLYVLRLDTEQNRVILGSDSDLFTTDVDVREVNWINGLPEQSEFCCKAKLRYRHTEQPAAVTVLAPDRIHLRFNEPQRAVTPGQSAVLYDGDTVLGGGIIAG